MSLNKETLKSFIRFQEDELTGSIVYAQLASIVKDDANKKILLQISVEEKAHYEILKRYTGVDVKPKRMRIAKYYWLARILGLTFAIKLLETDEKDAQALYYEHPEYPELIKLAKDEESHEHKLIDMINEERLEYMSSVVLGLNDALVEFTGALAGFTLALNNSHLIALTGSITGIAAALSMASSEYLSTKSEKEDKKHPVKAAVYTGIAYIITVAALVAPFVFIDNVLIALGLMLLMALFIIAIFNYYSAVARGESFQKRFIEMAVLSFSVAGVSFLIGYALKTFTGIEA